MGIIDKIKKIIGRGFSKEWLKTLVYFFLPLVTIVLCSAWGICSKWLMAGVIMGLALLKQILWDVVRGYGFDWLDVGQTFAAVLMGIIFTS